MGKHRKVSGQPPKALLKSNNLLARGLATPRNRVIAGVVAAGTFVGMPLAAYATDTISDQGILPLAAQQNIGQSLGSTDQATLLKPQANRGPATEAEKLHKGRIMAEARQAAELQARQAAELAQQQAAAQRAAAERAAAEAAAQARAASGAAGAVNSAGYAKPTEGEFTSGFGARWGSSHNGIDLANDIGTPIYAVHGGTVLDAGSASGFGQWVRLRHDDGTVTVYGHVATMDVSEGDTVQAGQQIATMGNEGQSTGPHLHFEVIEDGTKINPVAWLEERGISVQ